MLPYLEILHIKIPMYGLCIIIGILVSFTVAVVDCKKQKLMPENLIIVSAMGLLFGIVGAKVTYIFITFSWKELIDIIRQDVILIINGGFVFYGGLLGAIPGAILGSKLAKIRLLVYENMLVKVIPLAHAFGRIGCLCAGCCYGIPSASEFAVVYENPVSDAPVGVALMPVQAYEAAANFALFGLLLLIDKKYPENRVLLHIYLMLYSVERFVLEFFRYDEIRGNVGPLSSSQFIAVIIFILSLILFFKRIRKKL